MFNAPHTYLIAEAGCSHNGNLARAINMIDIASATGCDCVKFQAFNPDKIPNITDQEYKYLNKVVFNKTDFEKLQKYCNEKRIDFLLTAFDYASVDLCIELGCNTIKVPSGRVTEEPFMKYIRSKYKPENIIVSSGMLKRLDITYLKRKFPNMIWLHCVTAYPAPEDQMNLNVLKGTSFEGLSDHTISTWVPAIAVACGAKIIEKHFTMSRGLPGPDQRCSLEPVELMDMVKNVRDVEKMLGDAHKQIMPCEEAMKYRQVIKKGNKSGKTKSSNK